MDHTVRFDHDLIARYDTSGPRYTSYPTAVQFREQDAGAYRSAAIRSNDDPMPRPLSLYVHIPFCEKLCFYCACNKVVTKNREKAEHYLNRLIREIALQGSLFDRDRLVEQLHFGGGTPTFLEDDQIEDLMKELARHFSFSAPDKREFSLEIDPRTTDVKRIARLAEMGFNRMSLGVQDVDPAVQKAVNRIQPVDETRRIMQAARDSGFNSISLDLIYGLPFQTLESYGHTLDTVIAMKPDRLAVYNYAHMPHLFMPQRRIIESDLPAAAEKLDILEMAIKKLTAAGYVYIGMDHFALPDDELVKAQNKGELQRNFQGYSTHGHCDLIGLGLSSIGFVNGVYAQNHKSLPEYYADLSDARLPLAKSYVCNDDDHLRRHVIQELMCHHQLVFSEIESREGIDFKQYFADELKTLWQMQADGLLELLPDRISVTGRGRLLLRNIAMVFDAYLSSGKQPGRFSKVI